MKAINLKNLIKSENELGTVEHTIHYFTERGKTAPANLVEQAEALRAEVNKIQDKLSAAIAEVEKKSRVRTITPGKIIDTLRSIDDDLGISAKAKEGIIAYIDRHAQTFPNAYKGIPESTQVTAVFKGGSWRVTNIYRARVRRHMVSIVHTDESKKALVDRFTTLY